MMSNHEMSQQQPKRSTSSASEPLGSGGHRPTILFILANWVVMAMVFTVSSQLSCYTPPKAFHIMSSSSSLTSSSSSTVISDISQKKLNHNCTCKIPSKGDVWTAQAGQDEYLFHRVFFQQALCCQGTFVEFGARNGIEHSNTYIYEKLMGWTGLLLEVDEREWTTLENNRPNAEILHGPVCPSTMSNVTIALSTIPGWTGTGDSLEPTRKGRTRQQVNYPCFHLAEELRKRNLTRIDYMTIDTEGSELEIVLDFPWHEFDIRVVQIEQLNARRYPAQQGKKDRIIQHMTSPGFRYTLLGVFQVSARDTDDLIFTRHTIDDYVRMTDYMRGKNAKMTQEGQYV